MKKIIIILTVAAVLIAAFTACEIVSSTPPAHTNVLDPESPDYENPVLNTFTVSFNSNGGTAVADITEIDSGDTIYQPTNPTKVYGTFVGWYKDAALQYAWNFSTDSITEDTTLYAKWTYLSVGDTGPAGGIIFYDDTIGFDMDGNSTIDVDEKGLFTGKSLDGLRYLESATKTWNAVSDPQSQWGYEMLNITGIEAVSPLSADTLSASIGNGLSNTIAIDNFGAAMDSYAAQMCYDHVSGEFGDWFLPSVGEIYILGWRRDQVGDFESTALYWSSSEDLTDTDAYYMDTSFGSVGSGSRIVATVYVRPIRAF